MAGYNTVGAVVLVAVTGGVVEFCPVVLAILSRSFFPFNSMFSLVVLPSIMVLLASGSI